MTNITHLKQAVSCNECSFTTTDVALFNNHSCDIQLGGGRCEDYPCCGHEAGDCNGLKYGSDEAIKQAVYDRWDNPNIDPDGPDVRRHGVVTKTPSREGASWRLRPSCSVWNASIRRRPDGA